MKFSFKFRTLGWWKCLQRATYCGGAWISYSGALTSKDKPVLDKAQYLYAARAMRSSGFLAILHGIRLFFTFLPAILMFFLSKLRIVSERSFYVFFRNVLVIAGPTFIKLGQWMATRPDLFDELLCEVVGNLHSDAGEHSFEHTKRLMLSEFKVQSLNEIFVSIDEKPVHSGCVGQVHRATVNPKYKPHEAERSWHQSFYESFWADYYIDEASTAMDFWEDLYIYRPICEPGEVAVKVLHPNIRERVALDLKFMSMFAKISNLIPGSKWFAVHDKLMLFAEVMMKQLDMHVEAQNLIKFINNFGDDDVVEFPAPYPDLVTDSILVETYIDSPGLADWIKTASVEKRRRLASIGLHAFLKMLFVHNHVHADMHPGNLLIVDRDDHLRMVCVDAGLVNILSPQDWNNFVELYAAVLAKDATSAGNMIIDRAPRQQCTDRAAFIRGLDKTIRNFQFTAGYLQKMKVGVTLSEILRLSRQNKVMLDSNFTNMIVAIVVLEGLGISLNPHINIVMESIPYVMHWLSTHPSAVLHVLPVLKGVMIEYETNMKNLQTQPETRQE